MVIATLVVVICALTGNAKLQCLHHDAICFCRQPPDLVLHKEMSLDEFQCTMYNSVSSDRYILKLTM